MWRVLGRDAEAGVVDFFFDFFLKPAVTFSRVWWLGMGICRDRIRRAVLE